MKRLLVLVAALAGCASFNFPADFAYREIPAGAFRLAAWVKDAGTDEPLHVYIEGDGHAFDARGRPAPDPTPRSAFFRKFAAEDPHPNVAYLARPCQFVRTTACSPKYWSGSRFAPEVIDSEYEAVRLLARGRRVVLAGYSGGAQVAALIAATKPLPVLKLVTVAGNLDHRAWTRSLKLAPLSGSLWLGDFRQAFAAVPQVHYAGSQDEVVDPQITRRFLPEPSTLVIVPGAGHASGWEGFVPAM